VRGYTYRPVWEPSRFSGDIFHARKEKHRAGKICLKRGHREDALNAYTAALERAPDDPVLCQSLQDQIQRVLTQSLDKIAALRDPGAK